MALTNTTYEQGVLAWRQDLDNSLRSDNGWLTLAGLFWLHEGENSIGGAGSDIVLPTDIPHIGILVLRDGQVTFHASSDQVTVNDAPIVSPIQLADDHAEHGATQVRVGSIIFFIIRRENQYAVRVRDLKHPARLSFTGRKWFAINPTYCINTKLIRYEPSRTATVLNTVGLSVQLENPGYVMFDLHGTRCRLDAFASDEGELWFIFKDSTNGVSTYSACRYLKTPISADDNMVLDFNRAYNPPCVFTSHATCPLPPAQNRLTVTIEAGERI